MPRPPPPPFPPFATYQRAADVLNERFRRSPLTAEWHADGLLADAGLLVHIFDGWEDHAEPWLPATTGPGARDQSASYVFAEQSAACTGRGCLMPLFGVGDGTDGRGHPIQMQGLILRPVATKVKCGKSADSSGMCGGWCPSSRNNVDEPWSEALDKLCSWRPENFGTALRRVTEHQAKYKYFWYNEIIIDSKAWRAHGPLAVEAIFGHADIHRGFIEAFPHLAASHPLMEFDPSNWREPMRLA